VTGQASVSRMLALVRLARLFQLISWTLELPGEKLERYRDTRGPGLGGMRRLLAALDEREDAKAARIAPSCAWPSTWAYAGASWQAWTSSTWTWRQARWPYWARNGSSSRCLRRRRRCCAPGWNSAA
jgi:hypothetical protein